MLSKSVDLRSPTTCTVCTHGRRRCEGNVAERCRTSTNETRTETDEQPVVQRSGSKRQPLRTEFRLGAAEPDYLAIRPGQGAGVHWSGVVVEAAFCKISPRSLPESRYRDRTDDLFGVNCRLDGEATSGPRSSRLCRTWPIRFGRCGCCTLLLCLVEFGKRFCAFGHRGGEVVARDLGVGVVRAEQPLSVGEVLFVQRDRLAQPPHRRCRRPKL